MSFNGGIFQGNIKLVTLLALLLPAALTVVALTITSGQLNYNGHISQLQNNSGSLCLKNQTTTCGTGSAVSSNVVINGLNRSSFSGIVANQTLSKISINGLNRSSFSGIIANETFPAAKISINGLNRSSFSGIVANETFPAAKISINGNNRTSFVSVANTTSANTINGHKVSFPSNATGTMCLINQTNTCGKSTSGGITITTQQFILSSTQTTSSTSFSDAGVSLTLPNRANGHAIITFNLEVASSQANGKFRIVNGSGDFSGFPTQTVLLGGGTQEFLSATYNINHLVGQIVKLQFLASGSSTTYVYTNSTESSFEISSP